MFGLVVIEGMTLSGHPWIINEILNHSRVIKIRHREPMDKVILWINRVTSLEQLSSVVSK